MRSVEARLSELVLRWEELNRRGQPVSAAELCADCPELLGDLEERIRALVDLAPLLGSDPESDPGRSQAAPPGAVAAGWPSGDYEILGELGRGGMGVVYRALDRRRGQVVALKALPRLGPSALYRFKREFRALADVAHPNLVSLHELVSDGAGWFITMELVEGVDFLAHVRPGGEEPRPERLRGALRQLAEGVAALHAAGKLHRDLKPSNVRVTPSSRVVVLDFGLAAELGPDGQHRSTEAHVLGTVAYMSPEQAAGQSVGRAADWYSVGVMLYEALVGRLPFTGGSLRALAAKQSDEPVPPDRWPAGSEDLGMLCLELLRTDPATRPSGREILCSLQSGPGVADEPYALAQLPRHDTLLIGRQRHLGALEAAFAAMQRGRAVAVLVRGRSGSGKTALVEHFLSRLGGCDAAVILAGRCYEQESVPYKALDGLVDALTRYLRRLPEPEARELMPRDVLSLARVFPVLRRVDAVATAPGRAAEVPDPQELRRRAFAALRELLARLGDRRPLVLFIDDLQWGDADSAALVDEVLRPPDPPALLLVGAFRSEDAGISPFLKILLATREAGPRVDRREISVDPLTPAEATELALELLGRDAPDAAACADAIARESRGSPFFVHELVRHAGCDDGPEGRPPTAGGVTLDDVLWARIERLPEEARRLLQLVAVSGQPLARAAACRAAGLETAGRPALAVLRAGRLVRGTGPEEHDLVEVYHDRIREVAVAHLDPATWRDHHHELARELEASGGADPEVMAVHLLGAGEPARAGAYYAAAADQAAETPAFDRAARLYELSLTSYEVGAGSPGFVAQPPREICFLKRKWAEALVNARRGTEAAHVFHEAARFAADSAIPDDALDLRSRSAEQFLRSGHIDQGVAALRMVLDELGVGLAGGPGQALVMLLARRALIRLRGLRFRERTACEIPQRELLRIDTSWSAALSLTMADPIQGSGLQARHLLLALGAGEPYRVALGLALESVHRGLAGGRTQRSAERILARTAKLAERVGEPHAIGMAELMAGTLAWLVGRWRHTFEYAERAGVILRERCRGVAWELDSAHIFSLGVRLRNAS
jgi:hypothetical protein